VKHLKLGGGGGGWGGGGGGGGGGRGVYVGGFYLKFEL
jgi:hypothetical protein